MNNVIVIIKNLMIKETTCNNQHYKKQQVRALARKQTKNITKKVPLPKKEAAQRREKRPANPHTKILITSFIRTGATSIMHHLHSTTNRSQRGIMPKSSGRRGLLTDIFDSTNNSPNCFVWCSLNLWLKCVRFYSENVPFLSFYDVDSFPNKSKWLW